MLTPAPTYAPPMHDIETIDGEFRLVSRAWRAARVLCDRMPNTELIDRLLDARNARLTQQGTGTGIPCRTSYAALGPRRRFTQPIRKGQSPLSRG